MTDLATLRNVYVQALEQLSSAQAQYFQTLQILSEEIDSAKRQSLANDDEVEQTLVTLRQRMAAISQESERTLIELGLKRVPQAPNHFPINIAPQQALESMRALIKIGEDLQGDMHEKYLELYRERKKWWKFW